MVRSLSRFLPLGKGGRLLSKRDCKSGGKKGRWRREGGKLLWSRIYQFGGKKKKKSSPSRAEKRKSARQGTRPLPETKKGSLSSHKESAIKEKVGGGLSRKGKGKSEKKETDRTWVPLKGSRRSPHGKNVQTPCHKKEAKEIEVRTAHSETVAKKNPIG